MPTLGGIALQDASYDALNFPCAGDLRRTYSDVVAGQLSGDFAGNMTVGSERCMTVVTTTTAAKNAVKTKTSTIAGGGSGGVPTLVPVTSDVKTRDLGVTKFAPTASKYCPGNICFVNGGGVIRREIGWHFLLLILGILI